MKIKTLDLLLLALIGTIILIIVWHPWFNKYSCGDVSWEFFKSLADKNERNAIKWVLRDEQQNVIRWISVGKKIDCSFQFFDDNIIAFSVGSPNDDGGFYSLYQTCSQPYYELWADVTMLKTDDGCKVVNFTACEKTANFTNYLTNESDCR